MKIIRIKLISFPLVCFIFVFILNGCGNKNEMINIENPKPVQQTTVLEETLPVNEKNIVIATSSWDPYEFEENGQIKGISVDIVTEAFKRMGYKVTKKTLPFSRAIEMFNAGEIDVIPDIKKTEERKQLGIFSSEPIITVNTSLFVKSDSDIKFSGDILDLKQYKIGIIRDYAYGVAFDDAVKNKVLAVEQVDDTVQNINKVLDNRIDICVENRLVELAALRRTNNQYKLKELVPELNQTEVYAWFSKKKNPGIMVDEFDKELTEIKKDGTFEKIYGSYIK